MTKSHKFDISRLNAAAYDGGLKSSIEGLVNSACKGERNPLWFAIYLVCTCVCLDAPYVHAENLVGDKTVQKVVDMEEASVARDCSQGSYLSPEGQVVGCPRATNRSTVGFELHWPGLPPQ